jgi:hypothetical protein
MKTYAEMLAMSICFDIDDIVVNGELIDHEFVEKLREAYRKGWYISIFSKRGQIEHNGHPELHKSKIVFEIQKVCEWFEIPFHNIQIGKPVSAITIDNSAITTDTFGKFIF